MQLSLIVLAALAVVGVKAGYNAGLGFGTGAAGLVGNFGYDYSFGAGLPLGFNTFGSHSGSFMPQKERNLKLTCQNGDSTDGLGVTIQERSSHNDAFGGYGQKLLGKGQEMGLNATIEVITHTRTTEPVSIIVTEKGFVTDSCTEDNFGVGVSPGRKQQQPPPVGIGGLGFNYGAGALPLGDPYFGYTAGAFGGGLGLSPVGALSFGFSPVGFAGHATTRALGKQRQGDGLITSFSLGMDTLQTLRLDSVGEFRDMSELAGRGVIVCTKEDIGYEGKSQCVGMVLNCCVLGYDSMERGAPV